jgi:outer membrane protein assembly factor BamB
MAPLLFRAVFFVLLLAGVQRPVPSSPADNALLDAAQQNDLPGVTRALERGANVNAKTRYNATALVFASMNGNLDMVKVLGERGADLTVQDTFYGFNPIFAAMTGGHIDVIRYLIEKGSPGAPETLALAIQRKNLPLIKAALARTEISDQIVAATHAFALKNGDTEMATTVQSVMSARSVAANLIVTIPPATLQAFTGTYRQQATGQTLVVTVKDDQLSVTLTPGPTAAMLFATSESSFVSPGMPAAGLTFERRGDVVERALLRNRGSTLELTRASEPAPLPTAPGGAPPAVSATSPAPADLAIAPRATPRPWPSFRGSGAAGTADGQGALVEWDVTTERNIRWKTPIPGIANSSPIVWGNRVFVTTAISNSGDNTFRTGLYGDTAPVNDLSEHTWKLYALDKQTGRIVWEREVYKGIPKTKRHPKGSQASSTPATDGRRVVVLFGTIGLVAVYDLNGQLLWKKDLGLIDSGWFFDTTHQWGHSSSPIIYQDSVILQVDRQKDSFVAGYDLATGKELWRTSRDDEIPTWGTPTVAKGKLGDELITNGTKVRGYDPETGKLRWTLAPNSEITIATPVVGPEMVYVTGGYPPARPIYAIRPGFSGDISLAKGATSNDAIAWSNDREGTYIPTPIVYRGLLYTLGINGIITAYDAQTGERVYRARAGTGGAFSASPVAADGRLYLASEDGEIFVIKAGREYVQLARHDMKEVIIATPAISDGMIIIRTLGHVYGIGSK